MTNLNDLPGDAPIPVSGSTGFWDPGDLKFTSKAVTPGSEPPGWLAPVGQAVSRATYSALNSEYAAQGYPHGPGDGSTTFNMPDHRGRHLVVKGTHVDVSALGNNDGLAVASRTPRHVHGLGGHVHVHAHIHPVSALVGVTVSPNNTIQNANIAGVGGFSPSGHAHSASGGFSVNSDTAFGDTTSGPLSGSDAGWGGYSVVNALVKT